MTTQAACDYGQFSARAAGHDPMLFEASARGRILHQDPIRRYQHGAGHKDQAAPVDHRSRLREKRPQALLDTLEEQAQHQTDL